MKIKTILINIYYMFDSWWFENEPIVGSYNVSFNEAIKLATRQKYYDLTDTNHHTNILNSQED